MPRILSSPPHSSRRYRKRALTALLSAVLLLSPLLVGSAPTTDMALLVAMSTITDVRDSLEEKLAILSQACARAAVMAESSDDFKQVQKAMDAHFRNAEDIQALAFGFLGSSSQRYPEYAKYWNAYRQRLLGSWQNIRRLHELLAAGPARLAAELSKPAGGPPERTEVADGAQPTSTEETTQREEPAAQSPTPATTASQRPTSAQRDLMARYREAYRKYNEGTPESGQAARAQFEALLAQEPAFHLARYWLARILVQQGRIEEARRHAATLVEDQPGLKIGRNLLKEVDAALQRKRRSGPASAILHRRARLMPFMANPPPAAMAASGRQLAAGS